MKQWAKHLENLLYKYDMDLKKKMFYFFIFGITVFLLKYHTYW